jgi:hypothetical protein
MTSRRYVLFGFLLVTSGRMALAKDLTMEEWMTEWMRGRQLGGALHVSRFVEPVYYLTKPIGWKPGADDADLTPAEVPIGFVTDFASIPQVFWSVLRPDGEYTYAAIIHDFLYWVQDRPRKDCDRVLKLAMQDLEIDAATVETIYLAVRAGGDSAWQSNRQAKANGEKRILKVFPDDPKMRWKEWKKIPDVFA